MEAFLIYLLKSSGITTLFLFFYLLFLKRETFFRANRFYLLAGLGLSIFVPFLVFTKIIWLEPMPIYQIQIPDQLSVAPAVKNSIDWTSLLLYGYCAGVFLFVIRFVVQLLSLKKLIRSGKTVKMGKFIRIETDQKSSPFSFFNYLVYNPDLHTSSELRTILTHEKIHAEEWHSVDMLAIQLFTIFQWCNPFVWWYRACSNDNLEYMADTQTVAQNTTKIDYQYLLLRNGLGENRYSLATPFFNSSIKKRIVMLNKNRSSRKNSFKYALMLPLLAGFIFLFNVKTEAQILPQMDSLQDSSTNGNDYSPVTNDKEYLGHNPKDIKAEKTVTPSKILQPKYYVGNKNPMYLVDGKEISKGDFEKIDINWIKATYVWKAQLAIDKFGDKGKNGVREIILKKDYLSIPKTKYPDDPKVRPSAIIVQDPIDANSLAAPIAFGIMANRPDEGELAILDGEEVPYNMIKSVSPESIGDIKVWNGKQAIEKYGDRGKNGAIEIILKRNYQYIPKPNDSDSPKIRVNSISINPLYILDGKEVPYSKMDSLSQENIEILSVWRGQHAINRYGDKGKNSVIEITIKK